MFMQNIPEGADIDFELELLDFDKQPNWHDAGPDDKIRRAQMLKEQGNAIFKQGAAQYARARSKWTKALKMLDNAFDLDTEEQVQSMLTPSLMLMQHAISLPGFHPELKTLECMTVIGRAEVIF